MCCMELLLATTPHTWRQAGRPVEAPAGLMAPLFESLQICSASILQSECCMFVELIFPL